MMTKTVLDMASMRLISGQMLTWAGRRSLLPLAPPRAGTVSASTVRSATGLGRGGRGVGRARGVGVSVASRATDSGTAESSAGACLRSCSLGMDSDTSARLISGLLCCRFLRRLSCAWRDATRRAFPGMRYLLQRVGGCIGGRPNGHPGRQINYNSYRRKKAACRRAGPRPFAHGPRPHFGLSHGERPSWGQGHNRHSSPSPSPEGRAAEG